jgi:hypothetical protein
MSVIGEALSPEATPHRLASSATVERAAWAEAASEVVPVAPEAASEVVVAPAAAADGDRNDKH